MIALANPRRTGSDKTTPAQDMVTKKVSDTLTQNRLGTRRKPAQRDP